MMGCRAAYIAIESPSYVSVDQSMGFKRVKA